MMKAEMRRSAAPFNKGCQDFQPDVPVGLGWARGPLGQSHGNKGKSQGSHIREHVTGVGQEGKGVREDSADHLRNHEGCGDSKDPAHLLPLGFPVPAGPVEMVVNRPLVRNVGVGMPVEAGMLLAHSPSP